MNEEVNKQSALERKIAGIKDQSPSQGARVPPKARFEILQICTPNAHYGIQYMYLRPLQYIPKNNSIMCFGDGQSFIIEGANMALLFEMLCLRAVSKLAEGMTTSFDNEAFSVTSITAESANSKN